MAMLQSVAKSIMEGCTIGGNVDLYGDYDYSETMVGESSFLAAACATLYTDVIEAHQSYQMADITATAKFVYESAHGNTPSDDVYRAVTEGVLKNTIDKLIASFKKFIAKIKEIYGKIVKWFKVMAADADTFVANYGDEVKKKAGKVKGYTYTGYKYQKSKGDSAVEKAAKACEDQITSWLGGYDVKSGNQSSDDWKAHYQTGAGATVNQDKDDQGNPKTGTGFTAANYNEDDEKDSPSEVVDNYMSKHGSDFQGASDSAELKEELLKVYRDDATAKATIKDFEGTSVTAMLDFLKKSSKNITDINNIVTKYENKVNAIIKKLNNVKGNNDGSEDKLISGINYVSQVLSQYLTLYRVPNDVKTQVYKEMTTEYLGALKGFLSYKGTSESTNAMMEASLLGELPMACFEGKDSDDSGYEDDEGDKAPVGESTMTNDILATINGFFH